MIGYSEARVELPNFVSGTEHFGINRLPFSCGHGDGGRMPIKQDYRQSRLQECPKPPNLTRDPRQTVDMRDSYVRVLVICAASGTGKTSTAFEIGRLLQGLLEAVDWIS